jgi:CheY-like chemotaxis protein
MDEPRTVLVIEDEQAFRKSVAAYLEDSGYRVVEAGDGGSGIELFALAEPDIVLTDMRMPGMTGFEVIALVREMNPATPVIVVSGTGDESAAETALAQGARGFITKPINDLQELVAAIEQALQRQGERVAEDIP